MGYHLYPSAFEVIDTPDGQLAYKCRPPHLVKHELPELWMGLSCMPDVRDDLRRTGVDFTTERERLVGVSEMSPFIDLKRGQLQVGKVRCTLEEALGSNDGWWVLPIECEEIVEKLKSASFQLNETTSEFLTFVDATKESGFFVF